MVEAFSRFFGKFRSPWRKPLCEHSLWASLFRHLTAPSHDHKVAETMRREWLFDRWSISVRYLKSVLHFSRKKYPVVLFGIRHSGKVLLNGWFIYRRIENRYFPAGAPSKFLEGFANTGRTLRKPMRARLNFCSQTPQLSSPLRQCCDGRFLCANPRGVSHSLRELQ